MIFYFNLFVFLFCTCVLISFVRTSTDIVSRLGTAQNVRFSSQFQSRWSDDFEKMREKAYRVNVGGRMKAELLRADNMK